MSSKLLTTLFLVLPFFTSNLFAETEPKVEETAKAKTNKKNSGYKIKPFTTDKGKAIDFSVFKSGLIKRMQKGKRFIHSYTSHGAPIYATKTHRAPPQDSDNISMIHGYRFGFFFNFSDIEETDSVTLEFVDIPPKEILFEGKLTKKIKKKYTFTNAKKLRPVIIRVDRDTSIFKLRGKWIKEIYCKEKLIFSTTFNLVDPSAKEKEFNDLIDQQLVKKKPAQP